VEETKHSGTAPTSGSCAVMCCGCGRVLGPDGQTLGEPNGGIVCLSNTSLADVFANSLEADAVALASGWMVRDDAGPNHRCPECATSYREKQARQQRQRRGSYIYFSVNI
jgi:hypothetical protein